MSAYVYFMYIYVHFTYTNHKYVYIDFQTLEHIIYMYVPASRHEKNVEDYISLYSQSHMTFMVCL